MLKYKFVCLLTGILILFSVETPKAGQITIDFENTANTNGLLYSQSYDYLNYYQGVNQQNTGEYDLTITVYDPNSQGSQKKFDIIEPSNQNYLSTNPNNTGNDNILSYYSRNAPSANNPSPPPLTFRVTFNTSTIHVSDFSICLKKPASSNDNNEYAFLNAYGLTANTPLDSDFAYSNTFSSSTNNYLFTTLSVSSSLFPISYVEFSDIGSFHGSIYWDDITYTHTQVLPTPEPTTLILLVSGFSGVFITRRKKVSNKTGSASRLSCHNINIL